MPRLKKQETKEKNPKVEKSQKISQEDFEAKVVELAKKGLTSEKIGGTLRKEGIHTKEHSKKISFVLKEKNIYVIPELKNIEEKLERIKKHSEKYKQDKRAMREKNRVFSQVRKMKKYFMIETR
jgi:ribosomal protein S15P/S13E